MKEFITNDFDSNFEYAKYVIQNVSLTGTGRNKLDSLQRYDCNIIISSATPEFAEALWDVYSDVGPSIAILPNVPINNHYTTYRSNSSIVHSSRNLVHETTHIEQHFNGILLPASKNDFVLLKMHYEAEAILEEIKDCAEREIMNYPRMYREKEIELINLIISDKNLDFVSLLRNRLMSGDMSGNSWRNFYEILYDQQKEHITPPRFENFKDIAFLFKAKELIPYALQNIDTNQNH